MNTKCDFKSLTNDSCFKYVFSKEIILKDFIDSFFKFLHLDLKFYFTKIIPESIIMPNHKKLKLYFGDIVVTLNDDSIISLEMYQNAFDKEKYNKSFAYMNRLFDKNIFKNSYKGANKVFSINLMHGNFRRMNPNLVNDYIFCNKDTQKIIDDGNTEMFLVRFDKVKKIRYSKHEERFITWLRCINANSLEELKLYSEGDEIMTEAMKFVEEWNKESAKNGFERYIKEKQLESEEKGSKKTTIEIAKNMLSLKFNLKDIIKATGLSEKEVRKLKQEIN